MTITGALPPAQWTSLTCRRPEPSQLAAETGGSPSGNLLPAPTCWLPARSSSPAPSPPAGRAERFTWGAGAAAELKAATQPCPSGSFQQGCHLHQPGPRAGTGWSLLERSPAQASLLLLWASLLPGPVPGQLGWVQGQGAGSLEGRAHGWSRCSDPLPSAPLNPATDASRVPRSRRLPPTLLHSRSLLSLTHAPAAAPSCVPLLGGLPWLLRGLLWLLGALASGIHHFLLSDGHSHEDAVLIHPRWPWRMTLPGSVSHDLGLQAPCGIPKSTSWPASLPCDPRQLPTFHLGPGPLRVHIPRAGFPRLGPLAPTLDSRIAVPNLPCSASGQSLLPLENRRETGNQQGGQRRRRWGWRDEELGAQGWRGAPPPPMAQRGDCAPGAQGHWLMGSLLEPRDEQGPLHGAEMREGTAQQRGDRLPSLKVACSCAVLGL